MRRPAKRRAPPAASRIRPDASGLLGMLAQPLVGAGAALILFLGSAVGLIALLGDPTAGYPEVRAAMSGPAPQGWRAAVNAGRAAGPELARPDYRLTRSPEPPPLSTATDALAASGAFTGGALPPAPIAGVSRKTAEGVLPVIGPGGLTPARAYARPFKASGRPRVAIVMGGLGLDPELTRQAIESLPPQVTLAFSPYTPNLQDWINRARERGHEILLEVPMEPEDYPENDPGPYTLRARAQPAETVRKLEWILGRTAGYFGITNRMGERFVKSPEGMSALTGALRSRGLAFVDTGIAAGSGGGDFRVSGDQVLDRILSPAAIDEALLRVEAAALQKGQGLGITQAYPLTLRQVASWASQIESRGYQLAPASALARIR
ncbi:MAG: divergent polysaccharide deacetylase family protein [Phenylobacterium sp.]|uniref:divergent polysaccharide deacetylase family protein n=1 Tax=Phenylobacterium sp. TaxID=1871053 RepID=UPI0025D11A63|nr:divergent polysaccharide deacetylase family protein [Phenylobacterium sp.]MCA3755153.1 divergent polysaccharide deacetylase family protein [Phenylobacterium sp.]MCA6243847.1 divergent polysaccharide deacetylase family protein [Phenylobacterium sp.]MCA6247024.1 divergent polysaccharide deacetylase family protein [Phenylobacterium sp.]MCA6255636.1 divergent polysaccharide deacetylase family protein [Phenylobacterium sp.]MCA6271213.1 divergent polysaccharide deacetylase family protein [Phenylo